MIGRRGNRERHVCVVVQNLPVPFDRRVWLECQALKAAGYEVSVVCPRGPGDPAHHAIDGIQLFKYRPFPPTTRQVMFLAEYAYSVVATFLNLVRAWRRRPFGTVQLCNPPDVLWAAALPFRLAFGTRMVYDQHDLCPELYLSRFGTKSSLPYRALLLAERVTYALAEHVISTNESYRSVALSRGRKRSEAVTVVRTGPDPDRLRRIEPDPALRRGHRHLLVYIGVMGPQDGVDLALQAMRHIVHDLGRDDVALKLIGDGDAGKDLRRLADELRLGDHVSFTGRLPDADVARIMSTADIGLSPDPKNPLNDVSTMNKTMEYMAFGLPVVAFDLTETRVSAGEGGVYARPNDVVDYAEAVLALLADDDRRQKMGALARQRVEEVLAWQHQSARYVAVYDQLARA